MVVEEAYDINGKPFLTFTTPKAKVTYFVVKSEGNGFFYEVKVSKGSIPKALVGRYTTMATARKEVEKYISSMKKSKTVSRDEKWEENHKDK